MTHRKPPKTIRSLRVPEGDTRYDIDGVRAPDSTIDESRVVVTVRRARLEVTAATWSVDIGVLAHWLTAVLREPERIYEETTGGWSYFRSVRSLPVPPIATARPAVGPRARVLGARVQRRSGGPLIVPVIGWETADPRDPTAPLDRRTRLVRIL